MTIAERPTQILTPYRPNLDLIAEHTANPAPRIIYSDEEYEEILREFGLRPGARLSDQGILRAMEAGLIKIGDEEGGFDLEKQIQADAIDLRIGHEFWRYRRDLDPRTEILLGSHEQVVEKLLTYYYLHCGESFPVRRGDLVLAPTQEWISLSNVITADYDGKSTSGRLGKSNHQTAMGFAAGFSGYAFGEYSGILNADVRVPVNWPAVSFRFYTLDYPSTRPRVLKTDSLLQVRNQRAPFSFWKEVWTEEKMWRLAQIASEVRQEIIDGQRPEMAEKYRTI